MTNKDNALAFVGQIMTAYKAVMKAEGQALKYAIECGEALNRAKENVESTKPKGKWKDWLAEHCKEIPPRHPSEVGAVILLIRLWRAMGGEEICDRVQALNTIRKSKSDKIALAMIGRERDRRSW